MHLLPISGEILKKKLTLEAKINGHLWNLQVVFALKVSL